MDVKGKVLHGTCGWSDPSIVSCGRFYPGSARTSAEKLEVHSRTFGCVEVDSSLYSIPSPFNVQKWVDSVPKGYVFHFKAFGLFCGSVQGCPTNALPRRVRDQLASTLLSKPTISLKDLPKSAVQSIWSAFSACVDPAVKAKKMGCIIFQFPLSFAPSDDNRRHIEWCRSNIRNSLEMAVEFRARSWFSTQEACTATVKWLTGINVALIAADELVHETLPHSRHSRTSLPAPLMPIALQIIHPRFFYIRLHRREGQKERLLTDSEVSDWAARIDALRPQVTGPIYFLWGTDWEDAPVVNAKKLQASLPMSCRFDWAKFVRQQTTKRRNTLTSLLSSASTKVAKVSQRSSLPAGSSAGLHGASHTPDLNLISNLKSNLSSTAAHSHEGAAQAALTTTTPTLNPTTTSTATAAPSGDVDMLDASAEPLNAAQATPDEACSTEGVQKVAATAAAASGTPTPQISAAVNVHTMNAHNGSAVAAATTPKPIPVSEISDIAAPMSAHTGSHGARERAALLAGAGAACRSHRTTPTPPQLPMARSNAPPDPPTAHCPAPRSAPLLHPPIASTHRNTANNRSTSGSGALPQPNDPPSNPGVEPAGTPQASARNVLTHVVHSTHGTHTNTARKGAMPTLPQPPQTLTSSRADPNLSDQQHPPRPQLQGDVVIDDVILDTPEKRASQAVNATQCSTPDLHRPGSQGPHLSQSSIATPVTPKSPVSKGRCAGCSAPRLPGGGGTAAVDMAQEQCSAWGNSARTGPPNLPGTSWFAPPTSERGAGASAGNTANPSESSPKTSINRIQKEHSAAQAHVSDRPTASHAPQQSQPTTDHDPKDLGTGQEAHTATTNLAHKFSKLVQKVPESAVRKPPDTPTGHPPKPTDSNKKPTTGVMGAYFKSSLASKDDKHTPLSTTTTNTPTTTATPLEKLASSHNHVAHASASGSKGNKVHANTIAPKGKGKTAASTDKVANKKGSKAKSLSKVSAGQTKKDLENTGGLKQATLGRFFSN